MALGLALLGDVAVAEQPPKLRLKIAAGSAPMALSEFIRQTGMQVLFEFDAVRNHSTRAVSGQFEVAEALAAMLEGSGLMYEFVNDRTFAVRPQPLSPPAAEGAAPSKPADSHPALSPSPPSAVGRMPAPLRLIAIFAALALR